MAWSPYKNMVIDYVKSHPGCSKWDVAQYCTRSCLRNPSRQYYIVNTAIRNDWIEAEWAGNKYKLYVE